MFSNDVDLNSWQTRVRKLLIETDSSVSEVAKAVGYSRSTVKALMKREKIVRPLRQTKPGPQRWSALSEISLDHLRIGHRVIKLRDQFTKRDFAKRLGMSAMAIGKMESGRHDFTLSELQRISELQGWPIIEIKLQPVGPASGTMH